MISRDKQILTQRLPYLSCLRSPMFWFSTSRTRWTKRVSKALTPALSLLTSKASKKEWKKNAVRFQRFKIFSKCVFQRWTTFPCSGDIYAHKNCLLIEWCQPWQTWYPSTKIISKFVLNCISVFFIIFP